MAKAGNCEVSKIALQSDTLWLAKTKADAALSDNRTGAIDRMKLHREVGTIDDKLEHLIDRASFTQARSHEGAAFQMAAMSDYVETLAQSLTRKQMDKLQRFTHSVFGFVATVGRLKPTPSVAGLLRDADAGCGNGLVIDAKPVRAKSVNRVKNHRVKVAPVRLVSSDRQAKAS